MSLNGGLISMETARRVMLFPPLRELVEAARSERGRLPLESEERQFFLGVEAGAQGFLHPESLAGRAENWSTHETPAFQEGYLAMLAEIKTALATEQVPIRLALPEPPARFAFTNREPAW